MLLFFGPQAPCIPSPGNPCTISQNKSLQAYYKLMLSAVQAVTSGKPTNGVYIDGCYVHEQNVNYCSTQSIPNCVGWSPLESGSQKWGYSTSLASLTPQMAFGQYYRGDHSQAVLIDQHNMLDNPSCIYLGHPADTAHVLYPNITDKLILAH